MIYVDGLDCGQSAPVHIYIPWNLITSDCIGVISISESLFIPKYITSVTTHLVARTSVLDFLRSQHQLIRISLLNITLDLVCATNLPVYRK